MQKELKKMNYLDKTKEELISELQKLQEEYDIVKSSYSNERTEFRQVEEALYLSENQYPTLAENTSLIIARLDRTFHHLYVNPAAFRITGIHPEEFIGKTHRELGFPEEQCNFWEAAIEKVYTTGRSVHESVEFKGIQGEVFLDWWLYPEFDALGNILSVLSNVHDITERKLLEKELHLQSEIMKNISEGINLIRVRDEVIVFTNPKFEKMFGYSSGELIGKHVSILNAPGDKSPEEVKQDIVDTLKSSGEWHGEILNKKKNGDSFWCYGNISEFDHPDFGKVYLSVHTNINKRKKAEEALQNSEKQYRQLFDQMLNGLMVCEVICDESGVPYDHRFIQGNPAFEKLTGLSLKEQIGRTGKDFAIGWPPEIVQQLYRVAMTGESFRYERFNETLGRHYETRVFSPRKGQFAHIFTDITERRQAEDGLRLALDWKEAIFEESLDAIFISSRDARLIDVNKAACDLTGYSKEQLLTMSIPDLHEVNDLEAFIKYNERIFSGEKVLSEAKIMRQDGIKIETEFNNSCIFISGKSYMHTTARDITDRKKSERKLFQFGERDRLLMENSGLGIGYYSVDGKILMFNQQAINNLGGNAADYIGKNVTEVFGKEAGQIYIDRFRIVSASEKLLKFEDNVNLDGNPGCYMSTHTAIIDQNGNVDGILVISDNITQKKIAENTILEKNANLTAILENTKDMIASRDKNHRLLAFNTPFRNIIKKLYNIEAIPGLNTLKYLDTKEEKRWIKILNDVLAGNTFRSEFEWDFGNGDIPTYAISYQPIIKNDKIIGTLETNRDITESKKADDKIRHGYLYARSLIEASLDPLVTIDVEGKITDVNISTEQITGIRREELIGTDFDDYFADPNKARKGYKIVFSKGIVKDYPLTIVNSNGNITDVMFNATVFKNEEGEVQGVFAAVRDITVQKKMEADLRSSRKLLEKLNQHLHDIWESEKAQIGMNLHDDLGQKLTAYIMDLAWIKGRIGVQSPLISRKLKEMSSEITETIEGLKEISTFLRPSILFDLGLVPAIISHLNKFEKQSGIICSFTYNSDELNIDNRLSLIFYRILQESMTNVARHSSATNTVVKLTRFENRIELIIRDNGIGIDQGKIDSSSSMGFAGIKERVNIVNGKVVITGQKGSGTTIKVTVPLKNNNKE